MFVSLSFPGSVACLAIVQVLCGLTHQVLELHRLDEFCVPLQFFSSTQFTTLYFLVMSCISTLFSYELVLEFILCMGFLAVKLRFSVGLPGACRLWHSRRISFVFHPRMHTLFLASNFAVFSSSSSPVPRCLLDVASVSDEKIRQLYASSSWKLSFHR